MSGSTKHNEDAETEILLSKVRQKQDAEGTLAHDKVMHGPTSVVIASTFEHVGRLERDLGNVAAAREHYEKALDIDESTLGPVHPATVRCREELESIDAELGA